MDGIGVAVVERLIGIVRAYLLAGFIFSIPFVIFGIHRVDPDAKGWSIGFRIVIIPGLCVFWPLFALRWFKGKQRPMERNAHRVVASSSPPSPRSGEAT